MLEIVLLIAGVLLVLYIAASVKIVIGGNHYHAMVRQAVIAEIGMPALAILTQKPIIEQITNCYRKGYPVASTAAALVMLIRRDLEPAEGED